MICVHHNEVLKSLLTNIHHITIYLGPEYSDKLALMLLDDDDEDDETEYVSALHYDSEDYERRGFWNEYTGREGQFIILTLT